MRPSATPRHGLLAQFRAFHAEVAALKVSPPADPAAASDGLLRILEEQAVEAGRQGGEYGATLYREAQYVMAALADEICLYQVPWPEDAQWGPHLLERRVFGTNQAGDELYRRARRLLELRDPLHGELARVYLSALALGFQGRHRGGDDGGRIGGLKRRLFEFAYRREPPPDGAGARLAPQAYEHTLTGWQPRALPHLGRWLRVLLAVFAVLLVVSHLLWLDATGDLRQGLEPLVQAGEGGA